MTTENNDGIDETIIVTELPQVIPFVIGINSFREALFELEQYLTKKYIPKDTNEIEIVAVEDAKLFLELIKKYMVETHKQLDIQGTIDLLQKQAEKINISKVMKNIQMPPDNKFN